MRLILVQPTLGVAADNGARIVRAVDALLASADAPLGLASTDLLVLPEHWCLEPSADRYEREVRALASRYGCHVVGGSQHVVREGRRTNRGVVVAPDGSVRCDYEKLRPYGRELDVIDPGSRYGAFDLDGHSVLVLLCADFWFFDLVQRAPRVPELLLVPALSVSRKPTPDYSRALWRHMAISRAYELACFVGVSDWAHESTLPALKSSGVAGFADPSVIAPDAMFRSVPGSAALFELDFTALHALRADRRAQGFLWQPDAP